ncbi:hypothetical protein G6F62_014687 [Rhizopus arrhizus]|nr:hypothetical protein G6F62_014687 [Rhizopus arrhizus]
MASSIPASVTSEAAMSNTTPATTIAAVPKNDVRTTATEFWRKFKKQKLGVGALQVPAAGQALVDTLRTAVAHMLISRLDPRWRDDFRRPAAHGP